MADDKAKPDFAAGIDAADLADGEMMAGTVGGDDVLLLRQGDAFRAFSAKCTHLGAPLASGLLHDGQIRCPWHHARFSAETGQAEGAPGYKPLACYNVHREGGRVTVTGKAKEAHADTGAKAPRVVIVGTGAAGHACARELAKLGSVENVTLLSAETDAPYDRTFCSKAYLAGKAPLEKLWLEGDEALQARGLTLRLGARVERIDRDARAVVLEGGERLAYDALVLATGGEPKRPTLPGFERDNVHVLRSLADAKALIESAGKARRAAVMGASFIGLEAAAALTQRGLEVEVVAPGKVPLARVLGEEVGALVKTVHEENGVRFHMGAKAAAFDGARLELDNGEAIEADLVVAGIGVSPRTQLAEDAGLTLASEEDGGGVQVDGLLRTSDPAIYAVGDIASYPDIHSGRRQRIEHWVHAGRQGEHAARVILGETQAFADLPFFWTAHFNLGLRYVGHVGQPGRIEVEGALQERRFAVRYDDPDGGRALTTAKNDMVALRTEAEWEDRPR